MKIIYILPLNMAQWGYSLDDFLDTHFSVEIGCEMTRKGHEVELHTFWNSNFTKKVQDLTVYFHKPSMTSLFRHPKSQVSIKLMLWKFPNDAIIHFHEPNLLFYIPYALLQRKTIVIEHHGNGIVNPFSLSMISYVLYGIVRRLLLNKLLNKSSLCIVHSTEARESFKTVGMPTSRIMLSPNGIDISKYKDRNKKEVRRKLGISTDRKIILFVGRINREKGVIELIEAYERIAHQESAELVMIGPLQDKNLLPIVKPYWLGFKSKDDLQEWYEAADVFCLPSYAEPFGIVLLEAMYYNLPIVTTSTGGPKDFFSNTQVIFVKPKDVSALVIGLQSAINKLSSSLSDSGRMLVKSRFTWAVICAEYSKRYLQTLLKEAN